jgi:hypothetical protein
LNPSVAAKVAVENRRGALYVVWGNKHESFLERSIASVRRFYPELPIHVERLPDDSTLLDKAKMFDMSPFEETVFLDVDTVVLGKLDFAFAKAQQFGLACCICECPWARRYGGIRGDVVEYNTGVLFFTARAKPIFDAWKAVATTIDSSIRHLHNGQVVVMPHNDQGGFAVAVEQSGLAPFVLPLNWNFRPSWHHSYFGPIRIWHDYRDVPEPVIAGNTYYERPDSIIQFVHRQ